MNGGLFCWLRLWTPNAVDPGSNPGHGTRSHMPQLNILHASRKIKNPSCRNCDLALPNKLIGKKKRYGHALSGLSWLLVLGTPVEIRWSTGDRDAYLESPGESWVCNHPTYHIHHHAGIEASSHTETSLYLHLCLVTAAGIWNQIFQMMSWPLWLNMGGSTCQNWAAVGIERHYDLLLLYCHNWWRSRIL